MTSSRSGLSIPGYTITIASDGLLQVQGSVPAAGQRQRRHRCCRQAPAERSLNAFRAESGLRQVVGLAWTEAARFGGVTLADHPIDQEPPERELEDWSIHSLHVSGVRPAPEGRGSHFAPERGHHSIGTLLISWRSRGGSGDSRGRASGDRGAGATVAAPAGQPDMESVGATE